MSRHPRTPRTAIAPDAAPLLDIPASRSIPDTGLALRLTYRLDEVAAALGMSRRTIERERSAGRFPRPDLTIGKAPLWTVETIRAWIERGGRP